MLDDVATGRIRVCSIHIVKETWKTKIPRVTTKFVEDSKLHSTIFENHVYSSTREIGRILMIKSGTMSI